MDGVRVGGPCPTFHPNLVVAAVLTDCDQCRLTIQQRKGEVTREYAVRERQMWEDATREGWTDKVILDVSLALTSEMESVMKMVS